MNCEFLDLYEELSKLNESAVNNLAENKYTKEAFDLFDQDKDAKGVFVFTTSGKKIYKLTTVYHTDDELDRYVYYIDKYIPDHGTIYRYDNENIINKIKQEMATSTIDDKAEYVEIPELTDKDILKRTIKQRIKVGDYIKVLEDKKKGLYNSLIKHYNTPAFEVTAITIRKNALNEDGDLVEILDGKVALFEDEVEKITKEEAEVLKQAKPVEAENSTNDEQTTDTKQSSKVNEPKNAKLNKARQNNKKILKAFKNNGLPIDNLVTKATDKNGRNYLKSSRVLNSLRKEIFGEAFGEDNNIEFNKFVSGLFDLIIKTLADVEADPEYWVITDHPDEDSDIVVDMSDIKFYLHQYYVKTHAEIFKDMCEDPSIIIEDGTMYYTFIDNNEEVVAIEYYGCNEDYTTYEGIDALVDIDEAF